MTNTDTSGEPLRQSRVRQKWDCVTDPGFLTLPYVLLLHQSDLKISSEHLNVLLNFIAHWHSNGRMPHPRTSTIANRMGISPRSVQRAMSWLIENGFLAKLPRLRRDDPQQYDMLPLVEKLKPYAMERIRFIQEKDFERVLDDNIHIATQKTAKEMFGDVVKKLTENEL
ncbi:helix-turn-helix domain-containing protein [Bradyrhizobium sp. 14AA]|jgi:DNA replication protein DnaD|uniref:helix-turn-helix domain-containing protein n=1 Tax=Bradyrhizobium TaxID=374 RepID=UPI00216AA2BB|nr:MULTISPECIES: helix-turn-helix domain-containing protein [Bradyrhizobium]MCS3930765.1 DNA replication protein DnaD [Bradyrhizobium elkanii]MCS3971322.1 DNA replication protein DnaD [Bradyrhizobium japonicum]